MNNTIFNLALTALLAASLTACANYRNPTDREIGAVVGGIAGGAAGTQIGSGSGTTIATIVGTLAGAALGAEIGDRFGRQDRQQFASTLERTPTGQTNTWSNSSTGNSYAVTPTNNYRSNNRVCRTFVMQANLAKGQDRTEGTACRQPDGDWRVQ